ncbi:MAG: 4Fe-4S ferredoxin [Desulfobacterota bacterium]|jgi:epoxyqueuosine reductase QueG|nr:4Fe-4S ferredoxin [Thermodesulfobacteriota bacterium]
MDKKQEDLDLPDGTLRYEGLCRLCLEAGVDDVGFVELDRPGLEAQKDMILQVFPKTRSVIGLTVALNVDNARSPARYLNAMDIHLVEDVMKKASRSILRSLGRFGVRGVYLSPAFPMDIPRPGQKALNVSHKPVAEEAGLGLMGLSRMILHPQFGAAHCFSALLIDRQVEKYDRKLEQNPCLQCNLCAAACPVGAIGKDGRFEGFACLTHNYREVTINFLDWVDALVSSPDMEAYRQRFSDPETISWWQSLAYGPNYQCNHCLGVCPAGDRNRIEYEEDRQAYFRNVVKPLIDRPQTVYVIAGSPAEAKARANPNKEVKCFSKARR